jgi:TRAP transporter TAXI family solute receptor
MIFRKIRFDRDLLVIGIPSALVIGGAFALTLLLMRPAPPKEIVMSTGALDGAYHAYAIKYREILAREGVTLNLWVSGGAVENLRRLSDPSDGVDVAFVQGGVTGRDNSGDLQSLGAMYLEPLWIFHRAQREAGTLQALRGKRVAIGEPGSGTSTLAQTMLQSNGLTEAPTSIVQVGGRTAADMLAHGGIDAAFFIADPKSPMIQALIRTPGIRLVNLERAEAYVRQHYYLTRITLPRGVFDLQGDIPDHDIQMIATPANLVVKQDLHPALAYLLLRAAGEVHGKPSLFSKLHAFPAADDTELPLSPEAARYYKSGAPFLQRYLPFWAANLIDRLLVLLVPALVILIPAMRLLPALYRWRVRSRIYRWYARLKEIEIGLGDKLSDQDLQSILRKLDSIENAVNRIETPLAYSENLYVFRQHIDLVRQRTQSHLMHPRPA